MAKNKKKSKPKAAAPAAAMKLPAWFTNRSLQACLLFAWAVLLYANTLTHEYVQDDAIVITDNAFTSEGLAGLPGILKYDTFYGYFQEEGKARLVAGGRYRPLSLVTFALEVEVFGKNPFVSHLLNVLLFGLTCVVFYFLLLQSLTVRRKKHYAFFVALSASFLFAAHPLHTEVVANIKGRDEILALLGSLAALWLSLRSRQPGNRWGSFAAGLLFFLALLSKENAITYLAVVPLAFYFFTPAKGKEIALQMTPYLVAAGVFLIIRGSILGWQLGTSSMELMNNPFVKVVGDRYVPFTTGEWLATVVFTLGKYLQLLIIPHPLTHDYYPRHIPIMHWADWEVWLSLLAYLVLIAAAIRGFFRKSPISFGILYFLATLSIVSNLLFPVGTNMSERFTYMPSVGYCLVMAVLGYRLAVQQSGASRLTRFQQLLPGLIFVGVLTVVYSVGTLLRNPAWKDNFTLFSTDIVVSPESAKLRNAMGGELLTQSLGESDETRKTEMRREAIGHLREAVRIHPNYKNAYLLLGNAYYYLEEYEEAIAAYQQAIGLDPAYEEAVNNLGIAYRAAGRYFGEQRGDLDKAVRYLEEAYRIHPDEYETVRLLGVAYGIRGDTDRAIEFFKQAVELDPDNADALFNLGTAYYNAGDPELGRQWHERALELDPGVADRMGGE